MRRNLCADILGSGTEPPCQFAVFSRGYIGLYTMPESSATPAQVRDQDSTLVNSVEDASSPPSTGVKQLCFLKGFSSAFSAGLLGYLFGFVPGLMRHKFRNWGMINNEGWVSAIPFAAMSGVYSTVQCLSERLRGKDDAWNVGIAGFASGVVVSWKSGYVSAILSGLGFGALSVLLGSGGSAEACAPLIVQEMLPLKRHNRKRLTPLCSNDRTWSCPALWLGQVANSSYFTAGPGLLARQTWA